MTASILQELRQYKIPALRQDGFTVPDDALLVLYSRSGYSSLLEAAADNDPTVILVDPASMLRGQEQP
jgi:hypothetical protein